MKVYTEVDLVLLTELEGQQPVDFTGCDIFQV